jgi:hypothetical protein
MDDSDGIEPRDSLAIPEHLVFAFDEWTTELITQACDSHSTEDSEAVSDGVHLRDAFLARSLTPAQLAKLAEGAAEWMEPRWPKEPDQAEEVERLLGVARDLLELRDRALAVAASDDNIPQVLVIEPGLRELLRAQSLVVLSFNYEAFDEPRDLDPDRLLATAAVFRDAIAVLDTVCWLAGEHDAATARVTVTAGHLAQLERVRADVAMSIVDSLDGRERLTDPDEIAQLDEGIRTARLIVSGLWQIIHAPRQEA